MPWDKGDLVAKGKETLSDGAAEVREAPLGEVRPPDAPLEDHISDKGERCCF